MPTPTFPKPIKITVTSGVKGQPITIRNRTTGEEIFSTLGTTAGHVVDLENLIQGYTDGDVIDFMVGGERTGMNSLTISGTTPQSVTISTVAVTTGIARGI